MRPEKLPEAVHKALCDAYGLEGDKIAVALAEGKTSYQSEKHGVQPCGWSLDHYFVMRGPLYVGIELDGYMHT